MPFSISLLQVLPTRNLPYYSLVVAALGGQLDIRPLVLGGVAVADVPDGARSTAHDG